MAYFAKIDKAGLVLEVQSVHNNVLLDNGIESEQKGIDFLIATLGYEPGTRWIQTSYNNKRRNLYAGQGYVYDENLDAFIAPRPSEKAVLATFEDGSILWTEYHLKRTGVLNEDPNPRH